MNTTFNTPILFITFNRPNHSIQTWNAIKKQRPKYLYVFQDGARKNNFSDKEKCATVRSIFEEPLDWDCELKRFFSEENMGCGPGPVAAITWFFENVTEGIIVEDDTIPSDDFFLFAKELLEKYRNNDKVRAIGSMKIDNFIYGNSSYYFTMMNRTLCAWATWKRAWNDFDYYLHHLSKKDFFKALGYYKLTIKEREYWYERLLEIQKDRLGDTSWDQQFWMSIWLNRGIGISPNANLSTNIGFDLEATHTTNLFSPAANLKLESILPLIHPQEIKIMRKADLRFHKLYFAAYEYGISGIKRFPYKINRRIKKFFNHTGPWFK
jgi:hypothetical protein